MLIATLAGAVAFVLTDMQALEFQGRRPLLAPESGPLSPETLVAEIQADAVFTATIRTLSLDTTVAELRQQIDVTNAGVVIEVVARAPSAAEAQRLAATFVNEARDARVTQNGGILTTPPVGVTVEGPLRDHTPRNTAAAAAGGLLAGVLLGLVMAGREDAARHRLDVPARTGWPLLGTVPHGQAGAGAQDRAYARLAAAVVAQQQARGFRTLLILGVQDGDGATTVAVNLALATAAAGLRTTLVDADLADPGVHRALNIDNRAGFSDSLRSRVQDESWYSPHADPAALPAYDAPALQSLGRTDAPQRLHVLTTGPVPEAPEKALQSPRVGELLQELARDAALLIVNGPPLDSPVGARALIQQADTTLVVVNALTGDPAQVADAAAAMGPLKGRVVGAVLTRAPVGAAPPAADSPSIPTGPIPGGPSPTGPAYPPAAGPTPPSTPPRAGSVPPMSPGSVPDRPLPSGSLADERTPDAAAPAPPSVGLPAPNPPAPNPSAPNVPGSARPREIPRRPREP